MELFAGESNTAFSSFFFYFHLVPLDNVARGEVSVGRQPFQIFKKFIFYIITEYSSRKLF